jgi:hypothetical protein
MIMIVHCLGTEGSASTWTYNVVLKIFQLTKGNYFAAAVTSLQDLCKELIVDDVRVQYKEDLRISDPDVFVLRGHQISHEFVWFSKAANCKSILTIRDPKDSVASMMLRLGSGEKNWSKNVSRSLASVLSAARITNHILLSYERRFFENADTIHAIADFLNTSLARAQVNEIVEMFEYKAVEQHIKNGENSPEWVAGFDNGFRWHPTSMFNSRHLGDTQSGKWQATIRPQLHSSIQSAFDDVVLEQGLVPGCTFRFGEALFSPTIGDEVAPYEPLIEDLGACILSFCFLPEGQWKFRISGIPQLASAEGALVVTQSGKKVCEVRIRADSNLNAEFEYRQKRHDDPFSVFVSGWQCGLTDPLREGAIELEAVYSG